MKKYIVLLGFLFCFLPSSLLYSQKSSDTGGYSYETHVKLTSNAQFFAELIHIRGDTIEFELKSGRRIKLPENRIREMKDGKLDAIHPIISKKGHLFRDKDKPHFYHLSSGLIFGGASSVILSGANMSFEYKYRWRPEHFIVGQIGADIFDGVNPVLSESLTLGYDWVKYTDRVNPFLSGRIGWGIAQYLEGDEVPWGQAPQRSIQSGYRARLGTGVIFTGKKNSAFSLGVDLIFQQLNYRMVWPEISTRNLDVLHRRIQFNIGYTF